METPSPGLQPLYLCTRLCSSLSHSIEPGGGLAECAREEEAETLREYILGWILNHIEMGSVRVTLSFFSVIHHNPCCRRRHHHPHPHRPSPRKQVYECLAALASLVVIVGCGGDCNDDLSCLYSALLVVIICCLLATVVIIIIFFCCCTVEGEWEVITFTLSTVKAILKPIIFFLFFCAPSIYRWLVYISDGPSVCLFGRVCPRVWDCLRISYNLRMRSCSYILYPTLSQLIK